MKLFQNCRACGASITDKKLLQLLEVYPVRCPVCGELIKPLRPEESDEIIELVEVSTHASAGDATLEGVRITRVR